jgi:hypothetical protein
MKRVGCIAAWVLAAAFLTQSAHAADQPVIYVVKPGDTLYDLAKAYLTRVEDYRAVQSANHVANPRRMPVGLKLKVAPQLLRREPVIALLGAYRGPVTVTIEGSAVAVTPGMTLAAGAVVTTGADAFARIDLPDGSRMALPSQSQVRINQLRRTPMTRAVERDFTVEKGRGESTVVPLTNRRDRYMVRTPMSVSAVRGTEFHVRYDGDQRLSATEVVQGTVLVGATETRSAPIHAGFGASSSATGGAIVAPLLPPPPLLTPDKTFDEPSVGLDLAPSAQAQAYRVRLASDAGFLDPIAEATNPQPHAAFEGLANGVYFVKVSVIAANGLEGMPATYAIHRALNTLSLTEPAVTGGAGARRYQFRWVAEGEGARAYRFQLFRRQDPRPVIDEAGLSQPEIVVTDLQPGLYDWRVMSRTTNLGRHVDKWSASQQFHIGD